MFATFLYIQKLNSLRDEYTGGSKVFSDDVKKALKINPEEAEKQKNIHAIFYRMRNKNDVEDILMDTKIDGKRVFQPIA